jgi:hypothetical protein
VIPDSATRGGATATITEPAEASAVQPRARRRRTRSDVPWATAAILATPIAWYLAGSLTLFQNGFLDPYFYTGYVNRYGQLLDRYGNTYYATRLADIFPQRALSGLLGFEGGYYAWHYLLAVAALGSVYAVARRHAGAPTAAIVTAALVAAPWLPRALISDYVDGPAIAYILVGIYFVLGSRARMPVRWAAAGIAFSLAVSCNLFVVSIVGIFVFAWLCFGFRPRSIRRRLVALAWLGGAMVAVQLVLATFMAVVYPTAGFFFVNKSLDASSNVFNGDATYIPIGEVVRVSPWVLVPALAGIATIGFAFTARYRGVPPGRRALIRLVALFYAGCGLLFLVLQLAHQPVAYLEYYVDYLIPAFALGAIVIVGELMRSLTARTQRIAAGASIAGLFLAYLALQNWTVGKHDIGRPLLALGVITVVAVLVHRFFRSIALTVVLVMLVLTPFAFVVRDNATYVHIASGTGETVEWDVYRGAHEFQNAVLDAVPANRSVGFWYGNAASLSSIQSMFIYAYSKIFDASGVMPTVTPALLANVNSLDYLVLLGLTNREVDNGIRALCSAGESLQQVERHVVRGDVQDLAFAIFRRRPSGGCTGTRSA